MYFDKPKIIMCSVFFFFFICKVFGPMVLGFSLYLYTSFPLTNPQILTTESTPPVSNDSFFL